LQSISHRTFVLQPEVFSFHPIMLQCGEGHVMAKMVSCWTVTVEAWVRSQTRPDHVILWWTKWHRQRLQCTLSV